MPAASADHSVSSMLMAVRRPLAALGIEARYSSAGVMEATPAADVHHAVPSMLAASQRRCVAALDVIARLPSARAM